MDVGGEGDTYMLDDTVPKLGEGGIGLSVHLGLLDGSQEVVVPLEI